MNKLIATATLALLTACSGPSNNPQVNEPVVEIVSPPHNIVEGAAKAPLQEEISKRVANYVRVAPYAATAGAITETGFEQINQSGFKLVVDLRIPDDEGFEKESQLASQLNVKYVSLPFSENKRVWRNVDRLALLLEDPSNYPVLIHCRSGNRAGAMWAFYRARQGVPGHIALKEGVEAGLTKAEPLVRELLGLDRPIQNDA